MLSIDSDLNKLVSAIESANEIALSTHILPDGDGLGCEVALALALKTLGKKVTIYNSDKFPDLYSFMNYQEFIGEDIKDRIDLAIVLDCSNLKRVGKIRNKLEKAKTLVKVDHHVVDDDNFGDITCIDTSAAATGIIVWHLIKKLKVEITPDMATAIYAALLNDTGCFRYSTTPEVLRLGAEILDAKADSETVRKALFQSHSLASIKLSATVFNTLEFFNNQKLVIGMISQSEMIACHADMDDLEGLVDNVLAIENVEVAILLIESDDDFIRISSRSKSDTDVSTLMQKFGGGGHKKAAGAMIKGRLVDIRQEIIEAAKNNK